ncbi:NAD(P)H-dependent oxidoreductase [Massilia eburnea]|uniref:NAD(P)H-dependent oxidoreductase n=1 Tax=Massilia eburnea TaxID=1776165 RepID=UPI003D6C2A6E
MRWPRPMSTPPRAPQATRRRSSRLRRWNFLCWPMPMNGRRGAVPPALAPVQRAIADAQHIVIFYPLWLGDMPACLKGFLEQVARPGFALSREAKNPLHAGLLAGRSARVVVTMGMPGAVLSLVLLRAQPEIAGAQYPELRPALPPVRKTLVGGAGKMDALAVAAWRQRMQGAGRQGGSEASGAACRCGPGSRGSGVPSSSAGTSRLQTMWRFKPGGMSAKSISTSACSSGNLRRR